MVETPRKERWCVEPPVRGPEIYIVEVDYLVNQTLFYLVVGWFGIDVAISCALLTPFRCDLGWLCAV